MSPYCPGEALHLRPRAATGGSGSAEALRHPYMGSAGVPPRGSIQGWWSVVGVIDLSRPGFPAACRPRRPHSNRAAPLDIHQGEARDVLTSSASAGRDARYFANGLVHHCCSQGTPSLSPSIAVPGQFLRKNFASEQEVI